MTRTHDEQFDVDLEGKLAPSPAAEKVDAKPATMKDAVPVHDNKLLQTDVIEQNEPKDADQSADKMSSIDETAQRLDGGEHNQLKDADPSASEMPTPHLCFKDRLRRAVH